MSPFFHHSKCLSLIKRIPAPKFFSLNRSTSLFSTFVAQEGTYEESPSPIRRLVQKYSITEQQNRIIRGERLFRTAQRQATDRKWHTHCQVSPHTMSVSLYIFRLCLSRIPITAERMFCCSLCCRYSLI